MQLHTPIGGPDVVATCMEVAQKNCRDAADISTCDTPENREQYEQWLAAARQDAYIKGFKSLIHKHVLHLKLYEIVLMQDLAEHPMMWRGLRAAFLSQASMLRQSMSTFSGETTSH